MKVLVNGIGNIGTTILNILADYKDLLGVDEVFALKNSQVNNWNRAELEILKSKGISVIEKQSLSELKQQDILNKMDYVFDCNANTIGLKNKDWYSKFTTIKGFSAQGSEKGFGTPFMTNINNDAIRNEKFVQIVSCNTHSLSALLTTFTNSDLSNLTDADFVIVRRSEDIGNHERLVSANVVSRHLDKSVGTHHAIDVKDLFKTLDLNVSVQSSDITTPSQLMHTVRFNLELKKMIANEEIEKLINENQFISTTEKFDSNVIFELGRKYSKYGRIFSHLILNKNNILIDTERNRIKGWAFIPQEGNTIISTIHAFLLQTKPAIAEETIAILQKELIRTNW